MADDPILAEPEPQNKQDHDLYPYDLAYESVSRALLECATQLDKTTLELKSADITFKTTKTTGWNLGLSVFILTLAFSRKHTVVHEITVQWQRPDPKLKKPEQALLWHHKSKWVALTDDLKEQILTIVDHLPPSQIEGGVPLHQITITVQFGVKWELDGGLKSPTLVSVSAGGSGEKEATQTVKIILELKAKP